MVDDEAEAGAAGWQVELPAGRPACFVTHGGAGAGLRLGAAVLWLLRNYECMGLRRARGGMRDRPLAL